MTMRSALYVGTVMHRRLRPRAHHLRYRVFWTLLDLDEIERLPQALRFFSYNRFNAVSFYDRDHGDGSNTPLRQQVDRQLRTAGIDTRGGPIGLLCMPRIFGYGFNPLSVYFCYRADCSLAAILYEVHNTFRERHSYLIPVERDTGPVIDQQCAKVFYVSPFMDMNLRYTFRVAPPGERVSIAIDTSDQDGRVLAAALLGKRTDLTGGTLLRAVLGHPALTVKVIAAIHWHALRLLLKGFKPRPHPRPPADPVTVVAAKG